MASSTSISPKRRSLSSFRARCRSCVERVMASPFASLATSYRPGRSLAAFVSRPVGGEGRGRVVVRLVGRVVVRLVGRAVVSLVVWLDVRPVGWIAVWLGVRPVVRQVVLRRQGPPERVQADGERLQFGGGQLGEQLLVLAAQVLADLVGGGAAGLGQSEPVVAAVG